MRGDERIPSRFAGPGAQKVRNDAATGFDNGLIRWSNRQSAAGLPQSKTNKNAAVAESVVTEMIVWDFDHNAR
jgi:hypothetical protein